MMKCPKCGSRDIDAEGEIDYVDDDKEKSVYYLNICRQCKHLFDKKR